MSVTPIDDIDDLKQGRREETFREVINTSDDKQNLWKTHVPKLFNHFAEHSQSPQETKFIEKLRQLIDQESIYVAYLRICMKHYLRQFGTAKLPNANQKISSNKDKEIPSEKDALFSDLDLELLFINIDEIYELSKRFLRYIMKNLSELWEFMSKPENIELGDITVADIIEIYSQAFKQLEGSFDVYFLYCREYCKSISKLEELKEVELTATFFSSLSQPKKNLLEGLPKSHMIDLGEILSMPATRLKEYQVLWADIKSSSYYFFQSLDLDSESQQQQMTNVMVHIENITHSLDASVRQAEKMLHFYRQKEMTFEVWSELRDNEVDPQFHENRVFLSRHDVTYFDPHAIKLFPKQPAIKRATIFLYNDYFVLAEELQEDDARKGTVGLPIIRSDSLMTDVSEADPDYGNKKKRQSTRGSKLRNYSKTVFHEDNNHPNSDEAKTDNISTKDSSKKLTKTDIDTLKRDIKKTLRKASKEKANKKGTAVGLSLKRNHVKDRTNGGSKTNDGTQGLLDYSDGERYPLSDQKYYALIKLPLDKVEIHESKREARKRDYPSSFQLMAKVPDEFLRTLREEGSVTFDEKIYGEPESSFLNAMDLKHSSNDEDDDPFFRGIPAPTQMNRSNSRPKRSDVAGTKRKSKRFSRTSAGSEHDLDDAEPTGTKLVSGKNWMYLRMEFVFKTSSEAERLLDVLHSTKKARDEELGGYGVVRPRKQKKTFRSRFRRNSNVASTVVDNSDAMSVGTIGTQHIPVYSRSNLTREFDSDNRTAVSLSLPDFEPVYINKAGQRLTLPKQDHSPSAKGKLLL